MDPFRLYFPGGGTPLSLVFGNLDADPKPYIGELWLGSKGVCVPGPGMPAHFLSVSRWEPPKLKLGVLLNFSSTEGAPYFPGPGAVSAELSFVLPWNDHLGAARHVEEFLSATLVLMLRDLEGSSAL